MTETLLEAYRTMRTIRAFEERVHEEFATGDIPGFVHLYAIDSIERRAYPTPWSRAMFSGELSKPSGRCYGAYEEDRLLAYLIVSRYPDAWHVMNLAVDPDHWRKGIGRKLLERLFADTARDLERGITLEVRVSNGAAIRLYRSLGFQPTGIRRGYYTDNREDALIMWRDPPSGPAGL